MCIHQDIKVCTDNGEIKLIISEKGSKYWYHLELQNKSSGKNTSSLFNDVKECFEATISQITNKINKKQYKILSIENDNACELISKEAEIAILKVHNIHVHVM